MEWRYSPHRHDNEQGAHDEFGPEIHEEPDDEDLKRQKVPEKSLATEGIKKNPKAIFEHVLAAAERREALERLYERRQEVKDDPATPPARVVDDKTTAVQIGKVIADAGLVSPPQSSPPPAAPLPPPPLEPDDDDIVPPLADDEGDDDEEEIQEAGSIYRTAVVAGFATGLILLLVFVLLVVLE
jgi:hypothetical protein